MNLWSLFVIATILIALGGSMAAVDSAIATCSRAELLVVARGARQLRSITAITNDVHAHLNAINFVRVLAEVSAAVLVTVAFGTIFDNLLWVLICSVLIMTGMSFALVGASPRTVGRTRSATIIRLFALLVHLIRVVLGPVANALVLIGNRVTPGRSRFAKVSSEEQLLNIVDEATELEVLDEGDRERIHSVFQFSEMIVRELMVPRTDMVTINSGTLIDDAMTVFFSVGYSRIPVVDGDADDVLGVLYLRDVSRWLFECNRSDQTHNSVDELLRAAVFIPESMQADALLTKMQRESSHLAMVVDEYGGIAGLVTLEDLIEELVGDIWDEYDHEAEWVEELSIELGAESYRVNVRLPITELGELFDNELEDDDVDSVGGLFAKELGRLPKIGDTITVSGLNLRADRTEGRRKRVATVVVTRSNELENGVVDD